MDKIEIPDQDVVSHESIAQGVHGLRVLIVNVYVISRAGGEWLLVDCGLPHSQGRIRSWAEERFGPGARPVCILLTHGHFDHTGSAENLAAEWNVPIYAHPLEFPYLTGESEYPPPDPSVGGGLMSLMARSYPRGPVDLSSHLRALPEDGIVPDFPDWQWIHTPGHTVGHVSLFREDGRILIAGDALATTKQESLLAVAAQTPELHGPPAYFTTDWDAACDSVARLAALRPKAVAAGHGRPMAGDDVPQALEALARGFNTIARPEHGIYTNRPAA